MASYQPPVDTTAIFNSQSFSASNYDGPSDPNKLDFPNAQGIPTMVSVNVSDGTNTSLITPTGITTSGTQGASIIDIVQIPEKNTANTFTQNQTISDGTNTSVIRATGITNSGAYNFNTTSVNPITTSNTSVLIGSKATFNLGADNTCLGYETLNGIGNPVMVNNTCVGRAAGALLHTSTASQSSGNTLVGKSAGDKIVTGYSNSCFGYNAGNAITSGFLNTIIGQGAGGSNVTTGNSNTYIGSGTSSITAGLSNSTAIGANASITLANQIVLGTAAEEVRIPSGIVTTSPASNLYFGSSRTPTLGNLNTAFGVGVFQSGNASTANNVGVGYGTLNNSQSTSNTAIGYYALPTLVAGSGNNTAIGKEAGGINAGVGLTSGSNNTFVGANATVASGQGAVVYSTAIGSGATITASNQVVLGTSSETVVIPNTLTLTSRRYIGLTTATTLSSSLTFPLSEIYNITPSLSGTAIVLTLPAVTASNVGAKAIFRITDIGNANVSLAGSANIFPSTSSVGVSSHTIYTGGTSVLFSATTTTAAISSTTLTLTGGTPPTLTVGTLITGTGVTAGTVITAVLGGNQYTVNKSQTSTPTNYILTTILNTHTFMLLNTTLATGGFGWFQLGTV